MSPMIASFDVTSGDAHQSESINFNHSTAPNYGYHFYTSIEDYNRKEGGTSDLEKKVEVSPNKKEPFFGQNIREAKETIKKFFE